LASLQRLEGPGRVSDTEVPGEVVQRAAGKDPQSPARHQVLGHGVDRTVAARGHHHTILQQGSVDSACQIGPRFEIE